MKVFRNSGYFRKKFTQLSSICLEANTKIQKILFNRVKQIRAKGFSKNPFFYFGMLSFVLLGLLFFSSNSLAQPDSLNKGNGAIFFSSFFKNTDNLASSDLFFSQNKELALETPDLKIIQDNSLSAVSTPSILNAQTLGDVFGGSDQQRQAVMDYTVQIGDTVKSLSDQFGISENTIAWANDISKNATLKVGQTVTILPVSGVTITVKSGNTIDEIAKTYKANADQILSFNGITDGKIYIGDSLIIPDGVMPAKPLPAYVQVALPNSSLTYPLLYFRITNGPHYFRAFDIQPIAGCGTPVYASAAGVVQRAVANGGWNFGMGNHVSILHSFLGDVVTYYGHLMKVFVAPGDLVYQGQEIGLVGGQPGMPGAGDSTGCHVHWEVIGAQHPLAGHPVGEVINVNK